MRWIVIFCLFASPAFAQQASEPRKIDFTQVVTDQDNGPILECADQPAPRDDRDCKTRRPVTLGMLAMRGLTIPERDLPPEENLKRGQLALSVYRSTGAVLTAEEITLIKKQLAKFGPLIVVRTYTMLDPAVPAK